jgi:hypothetical protein
MIDECQKVGCHNPPYTQRSSLVDTLIGKTEVYYCVSCLTDMIRLRMETQIFTLEQEIHCKPKNTTSTNW